MEKYELIDMQKFDRADYFYYFMSVGTTIEFTAKVDVTKVIERCKNDTFNFQAVMLFQLSKAINTIDNFKYDVILNGINIVNKATAPKNSNTNILESLGIDYVVINNTTHNYKIIFYLDEKGSEQNEDQGRTFKAKIQVTSAQ